MKTIKRLALNTLAIIFYLITLAQVVASLNFKEPTNQLLHISSALIAYIIARDLVLRSNKTLNFRA